MNRTVGLLLLLPVILFWRAPDLAAQDLEVIGPVDHPAAHVLRDILSRGDYLLIERDTVLTGDFATAGDLLIVRADVRLAGRVSGSVAVVHGALFTRPGSHIGGAVAALGGEVYLSRLGETGPVHEIPLDVHSELTYAPGGHRLTLSAPEPPVLLSTPGVYGVAVPTYDRVNGLTARVSGQMLLRRDTVAPLVRGSVSFATARSALGGTVGLELPVAGGWVVAEASRETFTNEAWIRGPLMNSLTTLTIGSDVRDYHESDVVLLRWERRPRQALIQGESFIGPRVSVRASRDRSLEARTVWSLQGGGDEWRENAPIDDGEMLSVLAGLAMEWRGAGTRFLGDVSYEWAPPASDFEFMQLIGDGRWEMPALWGHRIAVRGRTHQTLSEGAAPRQRWSFIGAPTLPTLPTAAMRGDRLVMIDTRYDVPLAWVKIPFLGSPDLRVQHTIGAAWRSGEEMPPWEQSIGAGIRFFLLQALLHVDPAAGTLKPVITIGTGFDL